MTVCLDTNVFLQIFGRRQPFYPILRALLDGRLTLAISTSILLEYEHLALNLVALGRQSLGFEAFCLATPKR
jgi:predicted nucleic acid-binding protein